MCKWGTTEKVRVKIPAENSYTGKERWDYKSIDKCIAPLVKALNESGIITTGSCCGHGRYLGGIELEDGRALVIIPDAEDWLWMDRKTKFLMKILVRHLKRWWGIKIECLWSYLKWRLGA